MNKFNQAKLLGLFQEIIETETFIDKALNSVSQPQASKLYQSLRGQNLNIEMDQLMEDIKKHTKLTKEEFYLIFRRFDRSRNGFISERDFLATFTSSKRQKSNNMTDPNQSIHQKFVRVIQQILESERILQVARRELQNVPLNSILDLIDTHRLGYIGRVCLQNFFNRNHRPLSKKSLDRLMSGLRVGHWRYINLQVLGETIKPLEFDYYPTYADQQKILQERRYLRNLKKQQSQRQNQLYKKAVEKTKNEKSQRRIQVEKDIEKMNQQIEKEVARISEQNIKRQNRRKQMEDQKMIRREIIKDEQELELLQVKRHVRRRELDELKRAEDAQDHLNYILRKQAQLNDLDVYDSIRRTDDFENELRNTLKSTTKKRHYLDRPLIENGSPEAFREPGVEFTLHHSPSYFQSFAPYSPPKSYFEPQISQYQRNRQLRELQINTFVKQNQSLTQASWLGDSSRSRMVQIEDELRRTELQLEVRRGKIEIQQKVLKECKELDRIRRRNPYIPTI